MATETRVCGWCSGAGRYAHAEKATERPEIVTCARCGGKGKISVYVYPKPTTRTA
jgi:DnaJ-class molecular chaperone